MQEEHGEEQREWTRMECVGEKEEEDSIKLANRHDVVGPEVTLDLVRATPQAGAESEGQPGERPRKPAMGDRVRETQRQAVFKRKSDEKSIAMIAGPMMVRFTLHTAQDCIPELELVRGILEEVKRGQGTTNLLTWREHHIKLEVEGGSTDRVGTLGLRI